MTQEFRNRETHAISLASGRPVATGETCLPDTEDPHDLALIEQGSLIEVETEPKPKKKEA